MVRCLLCVGRSLLFVVLLFGRWCFGCCLCLLLVDCCLFVVVCCLLFVVCCLLLVVRCLLCVVCC